MSDDNNAKCFAMDGKTPIYAVHGLGVMVRASHFNALWQARAAGTRSCTAEHAAPLVEQTFDNSRHSPGCVCHYCRVHGAPSVAQSAATNLTDEQEAAIDTAIAAMRRCGWDHYVPILQQMRATTTSKGG